MIKRTSLLVLLFSLLVSTITVYAQQQPQRRSNAYQSLLMRTDRPHAYFDHISFPVSDSTAQFAFLFRLDYDFVPFMKKKMDMKAPTPEAEYFGPIQVGLEIFEGKASRGSSDMATSIYRDSWQDTLWVDTYEETTSREMYTQGLMSTSLDADEYHYELQLPGSNMPMAENSDRRSRREIPPSKRNIELKGMGNAEKADFILLENFQSSENSFSGTFLNYGNNILYGQDYSVLVRIPGSSADNPEALTLKLYRLTGGASTDSQELRHSQEFNPENILRFSEISFRDSGNSVGFEAELSDDGGTYASVQIPNNNFENSRYKLTLENNDDEVLGEKMIQSQWLDMPVSLYNLNVAIDMLRFIVNDTKRDEIDSGSNADRERKFREFWAQRDPTQETEFNELMTEYYNRIDYAYNEFSSLQVPGYQTDQGKAYILYGPPDDVERRLPTNAPTREIWHYPNRTLIFEATTGFGDFKLISEQQS